jgi:hypothetical protein
MLKKFRRWLVKLLSDTEDDLSYITPPSSTAVGGKRPTIRELRDVHLTALTDGVNGLHVRVGRLEAKFGLVLGLQLTVVTAALVPWIQQIFGG